MAKRFCRVGILFAVCLTPGICFGIGDGIDGAVILFALLKFELAWTIFTLAVFLLLLLRKMSSERRIAYFVMLWIGQILYPFGLEIVDVLNGEPGTHIAEQVTKPVVLGGVTFPAGSQADYVRLGGGFWRRKLVGVTSPQSVKLGSLAITNLQLDESNSNIAHVNLLHPEMIDGWHCGTSSLLALTPGAPHLHECELVSAKVLGDLNWSAGTVVERTASGGWSLQWMGLDDHNNLVTQSAFGFSVSSMNATYTASHELQAWEATAPIADMTVGNYTFFRHGDTQLTWQQPELVRVQGYGKDEKAGINVTCVLVSIQDRSTRPCPS